MYCNSTLMGKTFKFGLRLIGSFLEQQFLVESGEQRMNFMTFFIACAILVLIHGKIMKSYCFICKTRPKFLSEIWKNCLKIFSPKFFSLIFVRRNFSWLMQPKRFIPQTFTLQGHLSSKTYSTNSFKQVKVVVRECRLNVC